MILIQLRKRAQVSLFEGQIRSYTHSIIDKYSVFHTSLSGMEDKRS